MRKWNSERGMSLVEATIILMVLAILTSVIAPSAADYINDARQQKAKEDVEVIGSAIARLIRDTGTRCLLFDGTAGVGCTKANRVDLLYSNGAEPRALVTAVAPDASDDAGAVHEQATGNWSPDVTLATWTKDDTMDNHLVLNDLTTSTYSGVSFTAGGGPRSGIGWRGAYVNGPVGPDPWGYIYQANTRYVAVASDATAGTGTEGFNGAGWRSNVVVMSSGANAIVETPFDQAGTTANGDDVIYVLKGTTR